MDICSNVSNFSYCMGRNFKIRTETETLHNCIAVKTFTRIINMLGLGPIERVRKCSEMSMLDDIIGRKYIQG